MKRSFWSLIAVQVQVLVNDNAAKLMLMTMGVIVAHRAELRDRWVARMCACGPSVSSL